MEDSVLFDWDKSTQNFFLWIERFCGIHTDDAIYGILKGLVITKNDIDIFAQLFDGDFNNIQRTVNKIMLQKVEQ